MYGKGSPASTIVLPVQCPAGLGSAAAAILFQIGIRGAPDAAAPLKPLRRWIWRAFLQSALIPLVLVESVLIAVYLYTNGPSASPRSSTHERALQDLDVAVPRGRVIDSRLRD